MDTPAYSPCCPPFDTTPWHEKEFVWNDKLFIKDSIPTFFHIPWPPMIAKLMGKMWKKAEEASAAPDMKDFLCLAFDPSPWRSEYYIYVTKDVPGIENIRISGQFVTKVFDGPYSSAPKWIKEMDAYTESLGKKTIKNYFFYTSCPKCAKHYGHNYVVAFAQV